MKLRSMKAKARAEHNNILDKKNVLLTSSTQIKKQERLAQYILKLFRWAQPIKSIKILGTKQKSTGLQGFHLLVFLLQNLANLALLLIHLRQVLDVATTGKRLLISCYQGIDNLCLIKKIMLSSVSVICANTPAIQQIHKLYFKATLPFVILKSSHVRSRQGEMLKQISDTNERSGGASAICL